MNPPIISERDQRVNLIANVCLRFNALMIERQKRWEAFCGSFATKRRVIKGAKIPREERRRLTIAKANKEAGIISRRH